MQTTKTVKISHRLDGRVFMTLGIAALISLGVFGYRYATSPSCKAYKINIEGSNEIDPMHFYTGMPLRFSSDAKKGDKCEWSFGTTVEKKSSGQFVTFSYNEPGQYMVGLSVNDKCKEYQYITISKAPKLVDPTLVPRIICPLQAIEIGKPVDFKDSTLKATSWEWRFGETDKVDAVTQKVTYTFKTTGFKTVTLIINGNADAFATCQIFVNEKAAPEQKNSGGDVIIPPINEKPKSDPLVVNDGPKVTITEADFSAKLWDVVQGKKFASDFVPYLCGGNLKTQVNYKVTGSKLKVVTFEYVCQDLEEMKERKIKKVEVHIQTDPVTNCINGMNITVSKKHLL